MTNTTGFDPQHEARFQRGYDPKAAPPDDPTGPLGLGAGVGTPTDAAHGTRAAARAAAAPRGDADVKSDVAADVRGEAAHGVIDAPAEHAVNFVRGTFDSDDFRFASPPPRRNPFVISLWILSSFLLIGGFTLVVQTSTNSGFSYSGNDVPWAMVLQQVAWSLAPAMLSTGFGTIVGLLFWHAFAWQRARSAAAAGHPDGRRTTE